MAQLNMKIVLRNGTAAEWLANKDVVLHKAEVGVEFPESGKARFKIGDGVTTWEHLPYADADIAGIDDQIDAKLDEFAAKISDDGVVNTYKELVDYVAEHAPEAAQMAADITSLQELVGTTSVADQIAAAIADAGVTASPVEDVQVNGVSVLTDKIANIPLASVDACGVVKGSIADNKVSVAEDGTMEVNTIDVSRLVQTDDTELILFGGNANGTATTVVAE